MYETIITEIENGICIVTINRPDKLNALNKKVLQELDVAIENIYTNNTIKAAIITGSGEKSFVAGADISEFTDAGNEHGKALAKYGQDIFSKIEKCPKPIVAAVNGFALGGGCELAMACHIRLAGDKAKFGQPEVNLGLIPGYGGTQRLAMLAGKGKAMELILSGNMITADEAKRIGLVNDVFPSTELMSKTKELLQTIMSKSPVAVAKSIQAINAFYKNDLDGFDEEATLFGEVFMSDDKREGTTAFLEKRKPLFKGN